MTFKFLLIDFVIILLLLLLIVCPWVVLLLSVVCVLCLILLPYMYSMMIKSCPILVNSPHFRAKILHQPDLHPPNCHAHGYNNMLIYYSFEMKTGIQYISSLFPCHCNSAIIIYTTAHKAVLCQFVYLWCWNSNLFAESTMDVMHTFLEICKLSLCGNY